MEPTSSVFISLLCILSAIALLITVFLVPRAWKHRFWRYVVQFLAVVLTTILIMLSAVAILNKENSWYTSWESIFQKADADKVTTQVFGAQDSRGYHINAAGVQTEKATSLQADPRDNKDFGSQLPADTSNGAYVHFKIQGQASGENPDILMWLPASYFQNPDRFYPVLLGFSGFPGSPKTYEEQVNFGGLINHKVSSGQLQDSILVVPDLLPGNYDSECVDGTQGQNPPKYETYVTKDLVPWLQQNLRTIDSPEAWATTGYSAGGWCAAMFSTRHPDIFGAALVQAGYFSPIYSNGQEWNAADDPRYLLDKVVADTRPDVRIYFFSSEDDNLAMDGLGKFEESISAPTSLTVETIPVGGHRMEVWEPGMDRGLEYLGQELRFFAPV